MLPPTDWTNATAQRERCSFNEQKPGYYFMNKSWPRLGLKIGLQATASSLRRATAIGGA